MTVDEAIAKVDKMIAEVAAAGGPKAHKELYQKGLELYYTTVENYRANPEGRHEGAALGASCRVFANICELIAMEVASAG